MNDYICLKCNISKETMLFEFEFDNDGNVICGHCGGESMDYETYYQKFIRDG